MTAREDLNLQDKKRGKTFVYVALSGVLNLIAGVMLLYFASYRVVILLLLLRAGVTRLVELFPADHCGGTWTPKLPADDCEGRLEPPRSQLMTARGDLNPQDEKLLWTPQPLGVGFAPEPAERVSKHEMEIKAENCDIY